MPIAVTCPHCQTRYPKIPDTFAGKTVKCKKEACRQDFQVPVPLSAAELEAAALSALNDAPAAAEAPTAERQIAMVCVGCQHEWTVPFSMAGKNVLCPECRMRAKVPEQKPQKGDDWRQQGSGKPSLAKENFEKPDDVQGGESKMVGGESLRAAGLGLPEIEPRTLKQKMILVLTPIAVVGVLVLAAMYFFRTRSDGKNDQLMADALKEFNDAADESKPPPAEAALFSAILNAAAGEYNVRQDDKERLKAAVTHFNKARAEVKQAAAKDDAKKPTASAVRYAVGGELALAQLALGGTDKQVADEARFRWVPDAAAGRSLRPNEQRNSVHGELQRTLGELQTAEFDLKASLLRRLTRELAQKGQPELAAELPLFLCTDPEQAEAKGIVGVELYRHSSSSEVARQIAEELRTMMAESKTRTPFPASVQTLWLALKTEKVQPITGPPSAAGDPVESSRFAYTGLYLLEGKSADALALAQRTGVPGGRLRALALCADWGQDAAALDAAAAVVATEVRKKESALPPFTLLRLAQLAGAMNKFEHVKTFADAITDDGLKAWAAADAVRWKLAAARGEKATDALVELPDDPKKLFAGHAWGRLAVARHNAALAKTRDAVKEFTNWPRSTIHPFALAGVALGLQDP